MTDRHHVTLRSDGDRPSELSSYFSTACDSPGYTLVAQYQDGNRVHVFVDVPPGTAPRTVEMQLRTGSQRFYNLDAHRLGTDRFFWDGSTHSGVHDPTLDGPAVPAPDELDDYDYSDLQELAKAYDIRANQSRDELAIAVLGVGAP
jgi:hypothetical protein